VYFVGIALIITVIFVMYPVITLWRERLLRAAADFDSGGAPPATIQPDHSLALPAGETLTLARQRAPSRLRQVTVYVIFSLLLAASGEAVIVTLLPTLNPLTALFPLGDQPAPLSPLDWLAVSFPLAFCGGLMVLLLGGSFSKRRQRITADDSGVTVEGSFRRPRFIPWNDILVFMGGFDKRSDTPQGGYTLWGHEHLVVFQIDEPQKAPGAGTQGKARADRYVYDGGYEHYVADARRLLATIAARSYVPLRVSSRATAIARGVKRRFPSMALELDDALAAPEAQAPLQPDAEAVEKARHAFQRVELRVRPPLLPILLEAPIWFVALDVVAIVFAQSTLQPFTIERALHGDPGSIAAYVSVLALLAVFAVLFAAARRAGRTPMVVAEEAGLTGAEPGNQKSQTIPWDAIQAWVVVPSSRDGRKPDTYLVILPGVKVRWVEPAGARLGGRGVNYPVAKARACSSRRQCWRRVRVWPVD
jgi:hypothetical protein